MSKYIVKDCPCLDNSDNITCHDCTQDNPGFEACINRNNCVMRQIIELCKDSIRENEHDIYQAGRMSLAINILDKLEIQEVE